MSWCYAIACVLIGISTGNRPGLGPIIRCLPYGPAIVHLRGTFMVARRFGPPNYGENPATDAVVHVPILRVHRAVSTCGDVVTEDSVIGISEIQMMFSSRGPMPHVGNSLVVTGTLFGPELSSQYTRVLIDVSEWHVLRRSGTVRSAE